MRRTPVRIDIEGINAEIVYHLIDNGEVKTLLVDFGKKRKVLSTISGFHKLRYAANHYICPPLWANNLDHFEIYLEKVYRSLKISGKDMALVVTGADMDNFAYRYASYDRLEVCCFATAGVKENALRMGIDTAPMVYSNSSPGAGTINIILFTNADLSYGAMAMAIINVTEAKAGALQDMDVRSTYHPDKIATGTGTDSVVVVSGDGIAVNSTSGHLKIGELIGKTARETVIEALIKQNGFYNIPG